MLYGIKVLVASMIIVVVTEIGKTDTWLAALIKSLPLISLISMLWLYVETRDAQKVADLAYGTFWFVLPTLPLFIVFPLMIKWSMRFEFAFLLSLATMLICYALTMIAVKHFGLM